MISSTARDLPSHREQVRLACERAGFAPHDMMEHLTALDADAVSVSLEMVARADVYIGVLAYRYGTVPDGYDKSITEMEYDRAVELGKPRLIFLAHEDHPFTAKEIDTGPGAAKLAALKDRIGKARVAAFFKSPEDLRAHVVEALAALLPSLEAAKPEDASARALAELHRRTSIPDPPQAYVAHPYTLLQTRDLVGRRAELNLLTDWVTKPDSEAKNASVLAIVAIGGMGKSAQAWTWFNQIAPHEMKPLAGRIWWSFYESDATFDNFLSRALCYVGGHAENEVRKLPWHDREALLLKELEERPYLIALDGLERALIAYDRMDASMLADDEYDQKTANYVVGTIGLPASAAESFVGQHRLRHTTDPRAGVLLQKLSRLRRSRVLITTRLYPSALQLPSGYPRAGCSAHFLRGLNNDDALNLWRGLGVSGSRNELLPIFNSVQNHPLLIQALASEVAKYRKAPGDFAAWRADHPQFDPTSLPLVQSRTHILEFALRGLSREHREVLETIVSFRMPTSYASLEALLTGPDMLFANVQLLDAALTSLEDRGLIGWDREANRYDAHPIVRGVVWQLAGAKDKRARLVALDRHFEAISTPDSDEVTALSELTPAIERYHTLIDLERFDDAYHLFRERLAEATFHRLSAHRERISWLERLISPEDTSERRLSSAYLHEAAQGELALSYIINGEPGKGIDLLRQVYTEQDTIADQVTLLSNLGYTLDTTGQLAEAHAAQLRALSLCRLDNDAEDEAVVLRELARHLSILDHPETRIVLCRCLKIAMSKGSSSQFLGVVWSYFSEYFLLQNDLAASARFADQAWNVALEDKFERDFLRAALLQGRSALRAGNLAYANERLHDALIRARTSNVIESELPILVAIGELELKEGKATDAQARLEEAWEGIRRGPYPLVAADAHNAQAELELALGNKDAAIDAATKGFVAAWCDGPPFCYAQGLRVAGSILARLGAAKPSLPAFDPDKQESFVDLDFNPKDEFWVDPDNLTF